jgi:integrase
MEKSVDQNSGIRPDFRPIFRPERSEGDHLGRRSTGTLDLHGAHYRLRVQVPRHLRKFFNGQHSLTEVLPTDSKIQAYRMKSTIVGVMLDQIRHAQRLHANGERSAPIDKQIHWAEWISKLDNASKNGEEPPALPFPIWLRIPVPRDSREMRDVFWMLHLKRSDQSMERFDAFKSTAEGKATPIESILPTYISESARKPRQEADCERAIRKMVAFMTENDKPTTIEHLTRRMVGDWISERARSGQHWKTINKDLSFCSGLFKFAIRRGLVADNPCSFQSLPKIKNRTKRAYTKQELRVLLFGGGNNWLIEAIMVLALSGMRADELAKLRVGNCQKRVFQLLDTKRGNRNIPIHSKLVKLIERRCLNKTPEEFLFHEFPTPRNPKIERSQFLSKHFAKYRRKLGLDEHNGGRQSAIDLHSLRRYFITQADIAGHRKEDIERVVGHQPQSLSLGLYADPLSINQMRPVVESVKLPK